MLEAWNQMRRDYSSLKVCGISSFVAPHALFIKLVGAHFLKVLVKHFPCLRNSFPKTFPSFFHVVLLVFYKFC